MDQRASLLEQILSGQNRQLQLLAASGLVPLPPEQLIPLQVGLTESPDSEIASEAAKALSMVDLRLAEEFVTRQAGPAELSYFALKVDQPSLTAAILRRRDVPRELLIELASELSATLQEVLVLRQDAIIDEPRILDALEKNPQITSMARRRVWEYREHLLPRDKVPPKPPEEVLAAADQLTEEEIGEAIEEARDRPASGQVETTYNLTEGQLRSLAMPVRLRIARGASRQLRGLLIRDSNKQVALAVLQNNRLADDEVERVANNRNISADVLLEVMKRREWVRKYNIAHALAKNPRTPMAQAIRLVPRLTPRDLRGLARDKNVSQGVRSTALRLYQAKR